MFDLASRRIGLRPASSRGESLAVSRAELLAPTPEHRGIDALAPQERAKLTALFAAISLG